jgi:hypothetical protein
MGDVIPELGKKYYFRKDGDLLQGTVVDVIFHSEEAIFRLPSKKKVRVRFCSIEKDMEWKHV